MFSKMKLKLKSKLKSKSELIKVLATFRLALLFLISTYLYCLCYFTVSNVVITFNLTDFSILFIYAIVIAHIYSILVFDDIYGH